MFGKKGEGEASLTEEKTKTVEAIRVAMVSGDFKEIDKLEKKLEWIENQMKKGKK